MLGDQRETDASTTSDVLQALSITILGQPASKANGRKVVRFGGVSRLIKSERALTYTDLFRRQVQKQERLMTGEIRMTIHIWYASRRPDLDESLILDLLQGLVYVNDRQVRERHTYWHLDKENPRVELLIEEKKPPERRAAGAKRLKGRREEKATCKETVPQKFVEAQEGSSGA